MTSVGATVTGATVTGVAHNSRADRVTRTPGTADRHGTLVVATETGPVTVVPQSVIARAPDEYSDPLTVPPLIKRAPPLAMEMSPLILAPFPTQTACPFATTRGPLCTLATQLPVKPTEIVAVAVVDMA